MRVKGDVAPNAYSINDHPTKSDYVIVKLCENAEQYAEEETSGWVYDEYMVITPRRDGLVEDIESNYTVWLGKAKTAECDEYAKKIRSFRNALLKDSDPAMLPDRTVDQSAWTEYRQALRDITEQEGFPYSVIWPDAPGT